VRLLLLGAFAFFPFLVFSSQKTHEAEAAQKGKCVYKLKHAIGTTVHMEKVFPEDEQAQVKTFFDSLDDHANLRDRLMFELDQLLEDVGYLIAPAEREQFFKDIRELEEDGGRFLVHMDYYDKDYVTMISTRKGDDKVIIYVPAYKLIRAVAGNQEEKLSLVSDMVHELDHTRKNREKRAELVKAELERAEAANEKPNFIPRYFFDVRSEEDRIWYIFESEESAVARERKCVPHAVNSINPYRFYSVMQGLQELLNYHYSRTDIPNFREFILKNALYKKFLSFYVERAKERLKYYLDAVPDEGLSKALVEIGKSSDHTAAVRKALQDDLNYNMGTINNRLNPELRGYVVDSLNVLLSENLQEFVRIYETLLRKHPIP